tara:strand:+ start:703 stop:894 length:192 start_codon:yes stop_codon:yes gene_type:complete
MTASKQAKELGLNSLSQVGEFTGQNLQTLTNWFNNKPVLFRFVLIGSVIKQAKKIEEALNETN